MSHRLTHVSLAFLNIFVDRVGRSLRFKEPILMFAEVKMSGNGGDLNIKGF